jgi:flagella basal body P-ring formation protein FlgA
MKKISGTYRFFPWPRHALSALAALSAHSVLSASSALASQPSLGAELAWLEDEARQWVVKTYGITPQSVGFAPIDRRIAITPCPEALAIDAPFGGTKTVRVRCASDLSEKWQVFLQRTDPGADAKGSRHGSAQQTQYGKVTVRSESTASQGRPAAPTPQAETQAMMVVVAKLNLAAGQALEPGAFALESRTITGNPGNYFLQADGLEFSELVRNVKAGDPIRQRDLKKALLIRRNHLVQFSLSNAPGLQVSLQLQAMDDGRIGDQIRLKNPDSGRVLTGLVVGRNMVRGL